MFELTAPMSAKKKDGTIIWRQWAPKGRELVGVMIQSENRLTVNMRVEALGPAVCPRNWMLI